MTIIDDDVFVWSDINLKQRAKARYHDLTLTLRLHNHKATSITKHRAAKVTLNIGSDIDTRLCSDESAIAQGILLITDINDLHITIQGWRKQTIAFTIHRFNLLLKQ